MTEDRGQMQTEETFVDIVEGYRRAAALDLAEAHERGRGRQAALGMTLSATDYMRTHGYEDERAIALHRLLLLGVKARDPRLRISAGDVLLFLNLLGLVLLMGMRLAGGP